MSKMLLNSLIKWGTHFNGFKRGITKNTYCWICNTEMNLQNWLSHRRKMFSFYQKNIFTCLQTRIICIMVLLVKNSPASAGDLRDAGSIPGSGRSPAGRHGNPLQYSCLENPMDRGDWRAIVHGARKTWAQLKQFSTYTVSIVIGENQLPFSTFFLAKTLRY